jgi:hypothetical protein
MCKENNSSRSLKTISRIKQQMALLALDTGSVFAALPRVRTGLAELRPQRSRFSHTA